MIKHVCNVCGADALASQPPKTVGFNLDGDVIEPGSDWSIKDYKLIETSVSVKCVLTKRSAASREHEPPIVHLCHEHWSAVLTTIAERVSRQTENPDAVPSNV